MENLYDKLKENIINNDLIFLEKNLDKYDINHSFKDEDNDSLLMYAISYPKNDSYKFFLKKGANYMAINDHGENIVHSIVYSGIADRLSDLLNFHADAIDLINNVTNDGVSPLLLSVLLNKYDIFNLLIKLGADVNLADSTGNAPIHPACALGNISMVKKLVNKRANLHVKTQKGNYPLALAVNNEHDEIIKYLYQIIY